MKRLLGLLAAFALACGSVDNGDLFEPYEEGDAGVELGQTAQALTRSGAFGIETDCGGDCEGDDPLEFRNGAKCIVPWDTGYCNVPKKKSIRMGFQASTCSSWWQARFVAVNTTINADHAGSGWQWAAPAFDGTTDAQIKCGVVPDGSGATGGQWPSAPWNDVSAFPNGTIRQWNKSNIVIDTVVIQGLADWASKTDAQRRRMAENIIRHEIYHMFGHGHSSVDNRLMSPNVSVGMYNSKYSLTSVELADMNAYVP